MNLGVTPPLSNDGPSPLDVLRNEDMEIFLHKTGAVYETQAGESNRLYVVEKLRAIVTEWATSTLKAKSVADEFSESGGGIQLRVFGSTRLGVHNADSDIDLLCLAPSFISRGDFFSSFRDAMALRGDVHSILSVPEAYTPVLKFTIDGQAVDMVFASLYIQVLPASLDILDVRCLKGLDDASVRSINGARVAEWICRLVPSMETFCEALRIIKYWARQRGMYSNMLGFLGGVNYAILVAKCCQLYPKACPFTLVQKFFEVFSMWPWPTPIMLRAYEDLQLADTDGRYLTVWNSQANYKDALHIMPIITPAYPAMNSAYNVSPPQFRAFQDEVQRACSIFQKHHVDPRVPWAKLFESCTREFFQRHPRYVQVDIIARNIDDQRNWFGWVESRLRLLILSLEQPPMVFCHPIANCFHRSPPAAPEPAHEPVPDGCNAPQPPVLAAEQGAEPVDAHNAAKAHAGVLVASAAGEAGVACTSETALFSARSASPDSAGACTEAEVTTGSDAETGTGSANSTNIRHHQEVYPPDVVGAGATDTPPAPKQKQKQKQKQPAHEENQNAAPTVSAAVDEVSAYTSTFIIGLSFQNGTRFCDVGPAIQEFDYKVKVWSGKKADMDMKISIFDSRSIPPFVFRTKAEPSNVESCTPKPPRTRKDSLGAADAFGDHGALPTKLFPGSAVKAPMQRESSDTSLNQGLSNHSISGGSPLLTGYPPSPTPSPLGNRHTNTNTSTNRQFSRSPRTGQHHAGQNGNGNGHGSFGHHEGRGFEYRSSPGGGPRSPLPASVHANALAPPLMPPLPPPVYVNAAPQYTVQQQREAGFNGHLYPGDAVASGYAPGVPVSSYENQNQVPLRQHSGANYVSVSSGMAPQYVRNGEQGQHYNHQQYHNQIHPHTSKNGFAGAPPAPHLAHDSGVYVQYNSQEHSPRNAQGQGQGQGHYVTVTAPLPNGTYAAPPLPHGQPRAYPFPAIHPPQPHPQEMEVLYGGNSRISPRAAPPAGTSFVLGAVPCGSVPGSGPGANLTTQAVSGVYGSSQSPPKRYRKDLPPSSASSQSSAESHASGNSAENRRKK